MGRNRNSEAPEDPLVDIRSYALSSGFPLENDVLQIIRSLKHHGVSGFDRPWSFRAEDEDGRPVFRSVDVKYRVEYPMHTFLRNRAPGPNERAVLTFLIEAKFTGSDAWWFIPTHPTTPSFTTRHFPFLLPVFTPHRSYSHTSLLPAFEVHKDWLSAVGGKKVGIGRRKNEQQSERDSLTGFQVQLIQATEQRFEEQLLRLGTQSSSQDLDYFRNVEVIFPILVTNGPLYLMGSDVTTKTIENANEASDIAREVEWIVIEQPPLAHIQRSLGRVSRALTKHKHDQLSWTDYDLTKFPVLMVKIEFLPKLLQLLINRFEQNSEILRSHEGRRE